MPLSRIELEELYVVLEKPLYNFALRWTWNPALAQDLVQDAFIRIWSHRPIERSTVKSLLYKTVQNLALNERRRSKLREQIPALDWILGPQPPLIDESFIQNEEWQLIQKAIDSLDEELRKTFLLCQFSDLTHKEIGHILKIPEGTVSSRKNRALTSLKASIKIMENSNG